MSQNPKIALKLPNLQSMKSKTSKQSDRFRSQTQTGKGNQTGKQSLNQTGNINQSQEISQKLLNLDNSKALKTFGAPFKLPTDQEVFQYCEIEKERRKQVKEDKLKMKIWEKNTTNTQNPLPQFKNFETKINEKHITRTAYSSVSKRAISAALDIIKERQKQKELGDIKKETVQDVLDQKKEMFLVTMTHGIIQEEIKKLQTISQKKSEALLQSEQMLEQDQKGFQDYLEQNKKLRMEAEKRVDLVIKERKEKEMQIKVLNAELTSLRSDRIKHEEMLQIYKDHKDFLEKLANKDFEQEKNEKIKQKVESYKTEWINNQLSNEEVSAKEKKQAFNRQARYLALESKYYEFVSQEEVQEIIDFEDNYPMHFKDPSQLVVYFDILEDKNLFLIQMKQNQEQQIDELKSQIQKEKANINVKYKALSDQRDQLKKQIDEVSVNIQQLTQKSESNDLIIQEDQSEIKSKIHAIIQEFQNEIQIHDLKSKTNLELLADIELFIEKTLKQFNYFHPKLVELQRKKQDRIRKNQQREELNQLQKKEQEIKNQKNIEKMMLPSKKREGRFDMNRSMPNQKAVVKMDETQKLNQEQDDLKYFKENFQFQM